MSGTTQSGVPVSSLPLATAVGSTDTLVGVVTANGQTQASQVTVEVLANGLSSALGLDDAVTAAQTAAAAAATSATAATENASNGVRAARGVAGGVAALDSAGRLALTDGSALQSALAVVAATQTESAALSLLLPLSEASLVRTPQGDVTVSSFADRVLASKTYVDETGALRLVPSIVGTIPDDITINGGICIAGATALPAGLSSNGGVIMTDGSVYYPETFSNGGVLCAAPNSTGA